MNSLTKITYRTLYRLSNVYKRNISTIVSQENRQKINHEIVRLQSIIPTEIIIKNTNKKFNTLDKENTKAIFNLAQLYSLRGKYDVANSLYIIGAEFGGCVNCILELANYYNYQDKNLEKAKHFYNLACEKQNIEAMFELANIYYTEGNYKDRSSSNYYYSIAINYLDKILELEPMNTKAAKMIILIANKYLSR
jgi:TPR repeat protein